MAYLDICTECGEKAEDHHIFVALRSPEGCVCNSDDWGNPRHIPRVCPKFEAMAGVDSALCKHCEHEEPCHAAERP